MTKKVIYIQSGNTVNMDALKITTSKNSVLQSLIRESVIASFETIIDTTAKVTALITTCTLQPMIL